MNGKIIKRLPWAMMTLILTACSEILPEQKFSCSKGHRATVQLNVSTASEMEVSGTRGEDIKPGSVKEGTEDNYKVSDFWLLEYGADGKLVEADGKPAMQYVTRDDLEKKNHRLDIQLPNGNGDKYRCVMIANTHDKNFFDKIDASSYETIDKLSDLTKEVKSLGEDTYNNDGGKGELYMNCVTDVSNTSKTLKCVFYRNVAKLTVKVRNGSKSEMEITGIQICNVPNKMAYADQLYDRENNIRDEDTMMADGARVMDMPREDTYLRAGNRREIERVYYLPRNCQGIDEDREDVEEDQKNVSTKSASATCVKVFATDTDTKKSYCYTFYIGENMTNDFNVKPNNHYRLPISIKNHGSDTDSRIECIECKNETMGANCIMMDLFDETRVYTIYPYKRINKYWGDLLKDQTRTIDQNYDWEATIIWQDTNDDVIEFVESGKETFLGKGKCPLRIKLKNPTDPCNVLIGVKKKGADPNSFGYLWSWHLWVTPYKPDRKKPWVKGKYKYNVTSGSVFRYDPGTISLPGNDLWTVGGEYYNKYIMDRDLGATTSTTPTPDSDPKESAGLRYQFGRKDPFVIKEVTLYKAASDTVLMNPVYATNMYKGVMWPDLFYRTNKAPTYKDWVEPNDYSANLWNNPFPSEKEFKDKSFFDPCPEGWRIPLRGTWNIFRKGGLLIKGVKTKVKYLPNAKEPFNNGWLFYVDEKSSVTAYYPTGGLYCETGRIKREDILGVYGSLWSASPYDGNRSYFMSFRSDYVIPVGPSGDTYRAQARSIRCVQE